MPSRFRRIQAHLTALPVFEAAARLGSFTRAGEELGISQPSVSRHIANLEEALGQALFVRDHNRLTLTVEGAAFAGAVDLGLSHIDTAYRKLAQGPRREGLTLACSFSFAHGWLLPRFSDLRRAAGSVPIHLVVSYWLEDVDLDDVDMVVNWRSRGWTEWPSLSLFDEVVYPVTAPWWEGRADTLSAADLLHFEERDNEFVGWERWFAHQGQPMPDISDAYRYSNYHFMIQAAMDGEGVALGWHHLVADQVSEGRLQRVGPPMHYRDDAYSLEYRPDTGAPDTMQAVLDWFRVEIAKTPAVPEV